MSSKMRCCRMLRQESPAGTGTLPYAALHVQNLALCALCTLCTLYDVKATWPELCGRDILLSVESRWSCCAGVVTPFPSSRAQTGSLLLIPTPCGTDVLAIWASGCTIPYLWTCTVQPHPLSAAGDMFSTYSTVRPMYCTWYCQIPGAPEIIALFLDLANETKILSSYTDAD
jgi:hypothetical protein